MCNNGLQLSQMKRFFPISLALLLVMASLGHVLAAAFCPRALGRDCCFAKTIGHTHSSAHGHEKMTAHELHMDGMSMDGMDMDNMNIGDMLADVASMDHMAMNEVVIDGVIPDVDIPFSPPALSEGAFANKVDQPVNSCAHCLGHSGIANAPVSFVRVSNQLGQEINPVLLPTSRFLSRPAVASAQIGLPREHAPPASSAPRHILISVFLI